MINRFVVAGILGVAIAAAACVPRPLEDRPVSENPAVRNLANQARTDLDAGQVISAAASLERGLRIEPRNARLWLELARVRLAQGDYAQVENLAARAMGFAGRDPAIRAGGWRLIGAARAARGDEPGAAEAERRRREYEPSR